MYRHGKRLVGALVAVLLATFMIGASAASADVPAPPWDNDPTHWTGVETEPGSFQVVIDNLLLDSTLECQITLDIDLDDKGTTSITNVDVDPNGGLNNFLCPLVMIEDLEWENQICERIADENGPLADHQYWDGVYLKFSLLGNTVEGYTFAELLDASGNRASGSNPLTVARGSIDDDVYDSSGASTGHHLSDVNNLFTVSPEFDVVSTEEPCLWVFPEA